MNKSGIVEPRRYLIIKHRRLSIPDAIQDMHRRSRDRFRIAATLLPISSGPRYLFYWWKGGGGGGGGGGGQFVHIMPVYYCRKAAPSHEGMPCICDLITSVPTGEALILNDNKCSFCYTYDKHAFLSKRLNFN